MSQVKVSKKNFKETRRGLNQQNHNMTLKPENDFIVHGR